MKDIVHHGLRIWDITGGGFGVYWAEDMEYHGWEDVVHHG